MLGENFLHKYEPFVEALCIRILGDAVKEEPLSNLGLNGGCRKNLRFSTEDWPYL